MNASRVVAVCATVMALTAPVIAHHSAAGIDRTRTLVVAGTVKEFRWTNPHSWIDLDVTDDKGVSTTWSVEMTSPTFLVRAGWKRSTLKAGDKVSVTLRPFKNGDPGGLFGDGLLEEHARVGELLVVEVAELARDREVAADEVVAGGVDVGAAALRAVQEAEELEHRELLAQRAAAHVERLAEFPLGRQASCGRAHRSGRAQGV